MSQIELRHLRTLAALRDTGSLVEAADRVFLTQSALSHQLKELESRIGCSLFVRKTRPVRFTSAGNRLLRLADEVLPRVHGTEPTTVFGTSRSIKQSCGRSPANKFRR